MAIFDTAMEETFVGSRAEPVSNRPIHISPYPPPHSMVTHPFAGVTRSERSRGRSRSGEFVSGWEEASAVTADGSRSRGKRACAIKLVSPRMVSNINTPKEQRGNYYSEGSYR